MTDKTIFGNEQAEGTPEDLSAFGKNQSEKPASEAEIKAAQIQKVAELPEPEDLEPSTDATDIDHSGFGTGREGVGYHLQKMEDKLGISTWNGDWDSSAVRNAKFMDGLNKSSYNPIQKIELLEAFNDRVEKHGGDQLQVDLQGYFSRSQKADAQKRNYARAQNIESQFEDLSVTLTENPELGLQAYGDFEKELVDALQKSGLNEEQIELKKEQYKKSAFDTSFNAILGQDPSKAKEFAEVNARFICNDEEGKCEDAVKYLDKAKKAEEKSAIEKEERLVERMEPGIKSLNIEQIEAVSKTDTKAAKAAKKVLRNLEKDPIKVVQDELSPISLKDPASMSRRVAEIKEAEERLSTSNRPVDIPYLTKDNISNLVSRLERGEVDASLNVLGGMLGPDRRKLIDQLDSDMGKSDAFATALNVMEGDRRLALKIAEGAVSEKSSLITSGDIKLMNIQEYENVQANNRVIKAIQALGKTDIGMEGLSNDLIGRITNRQRVGGYVTGYDLSLPHGVNVKQFRQEVISVLKSPEAQKKFFIGEPIDGFFMMEERDVQFIARSEGQYYISQGDKILVDKQGKAIIFDYNKVRDDLDTRERLMENVRRTR